MEYKLPSEKQPGVMYNVDMLLGLSTCFMATLVVPININQLS